MLPDVPEPLIDPERVLWELGIITMYADCSTKQRLLVEAWKKAQEAGAE